MAVGFGAAELRDQHPNDFAPMTTLACSSTRPLLATAVPNRWCWAAWAMVSYSAASWAMLDHFSCSAVIVSCADFSAPSCWSTPLAIGFGASQTGVAMAEDLATGMIDRFRSLPMASSAVLVGRMAAGAVRNLFVVVLMIGVASA